MIVDISKITLDNIYLFSLIGNIRKGQHLTDEEKNFLKSLERPKEEKVVYESFIRKSRKRMTKKEYQHWYYIHVTKIKRKQKRVLGE